MSQVNKLAGKTIKAVYPLYGKESTDKRARTDDKLEGEFSLHVGDYDYSDGETVIEFTDGTYLTVWSSEWGGIVYREKQ